MTTFLTPRLRAVLLAGIIIAGTASVGHAQEFGVFVPLTDPSQYGTSGSDNLSPDANHHIVYDGPASSGSGSDHRSDGARDNIDTRNGKQETIVCGPEDAIQADPDDSVRIQSQTGKLLWEGKFKQYLQLLKLMHHLRHLLLAQLPGAGQALIGLRAAYVAQIDRLSAEDELTPYEFVDCKELEPVEDLSVFHTEVPQLAQWFLAPNSDPESDDSGAITAKDLIAMLQGIVNVIDEIEIQQP